MKRNYSYYVLTPLILIAGIVFLISHRQELRILSNPSFIDIGTMVVLVCIYFCTVGYRTKILVSLHDRQLMLRESVALTVFGNFINYFILAKPSAILKAWYLKSQLELKYSQYTSLMVTSTFISFFAVGSLGILITVYFLFHSLHVPIILPLVCGNLILVSFSPYFFRIRGPKFSNKIARFLKSAIDGFYEIRDKKDVIFVVLLLYYLQYFIMTGILIVIYNTLGIQLNFSIAITITLLSFISSIFAVTPNNLGVKEVIVGLLMSNAGYSFSTGVIGSMLLRGCFITVNAFAFPFSLFILRSNQKKTIKRI